MTSVIDPYRRFQRQVALQVGACWLLALGAAAWAWWMPAAGDPVAPAAPRPAATTGATATAAAIDPAAWNVALWRPFADEAPVAIAAAPLAFKLYSILRQGDGLTAAIASGDDGGLQYVKAGDAGKGFTVVRVEADGVVLRINGQEQRLGLGQ